MKIFVSVGFESFSFDRLLQAIDRGIEQGLIECEVFVQAGHSRYQVRFCESKRFLDFDEVVSRLREADIVVSHAGVGTTFLCLTMGKTPILFPRQSRYHEHVDDHQIQFAQKMESQGKAHVAYDEKSLLDKIAHHGTLVPGNFTRRTEEKSLSLKDCLEGILLKCAGAGGEDISK